MEEIYRKEVKDIFQTNQTQVSETNKNKKNKKKTTTKTKTKTKTKKLDIQTSSGLSVKFQQIRDQMC